MQILIDDNDDNNNETNKSDLAAEGLNELTIEDDELTNNGISLDAVKRLLGAVSFGYGVFQIVLSFMPPNALKLIKFLGNHFDIDLKAFILLYVKKSKHIELIYFID
jgi:hypothetical protein